MNSLRFTAAQAVMKNPEVSIKAYKDSSLPSYEVSIRHITERDVDKVREVLRKLTLPEEVYIFTTGSDGHLEKANRTESPIEFVVVCNTKQRNEIEEKIEGVVSGGGVPIDKRVEWHEENVESLSICNITGTTCPSRFLHELRLAGSKSHEDMLLVRFVQELQEMPGKKRASFKKRFVDTHIKQLNSVIKHEDTQDVDLKNGRLAYSGMGRKATKYSLLRPIQYTLDLIIIDEVRKKTKTVEEYAELIKSMPRQVPEQIDYMSNCGLLPNYTTNDLACLKGAYVLGLLYFQIAQHLFSVIDETVSFNIPDKEELTQAYTNTLAILKRK